MKIEDFKGVPDLEIISNYRISKDPIYVSVILARYRNLILKVISRWHSSNKYCVKLTQDDFPDVQQSANLAVILMMNAVTLSKVKVLAVTIKSYVYNMLNKTYRHRWYENLSNNVKTDNYQHKPEFSEFEGKDWSPLYCKDIFFYYKYHHRYNYYKLGMMTTKSRKKIRIKTYIQKKAARLGNSIPYPLPLSQKLP